VTSVSQAKEAAEGNKDLLKHGHHAATLVEEPSMLFNSMQALVQIVSVQLLAH
jgi:hypothetical protein